MDHKRIKQLVEDTLRPSGPWMAIAPDTWARACEQLLTELGYAEIETERLKLELDAWPNQRRAYESELARLRETLTETDTELDDMRAARKDALAEVERLRATISGHAQCERNMDAEVERLRAELDIERGLRKDWGLSAFEAQKHLGRLTVAVKQVLMPGSWTHVQDALSILRTALEKDPDREFTSGRETFPFGEEV